MSQFFDRFLCKTTNYKGDSGLPWWALTVLLIMTFILTVLYGFLASVGRFLYNIGLLTTNYT